MALKSGFFDAVDGDRTYNADDLSQFYYGLISGGVIADPLTALQIAADTGMTVTVAAGRAMLKCKYFVNTESYPVTLQAADDTNPRIDRIVVRLDMQSRVIEILSRTGTPEVLPTPPELIRNTNVYEISLAQISIPAEATAITQAMITDERTDPYVCGLCSFNRPEEFAVDAGENAIITHQQRDIVTSAGEHICVEIRCHSISSVTPANESWATGSLAWEISTGKHYALAANGTWTEVSA